jgi:homoserine kinase
MLTLGANLEGHGDNMAPALFGGMRIVVRDGDVFRQIASAIAPGLRVVLFVPHFDMPTNESRKLLPETLSRADVVHNVSRAAMLVAALARGEWDLLDVATQDRIHQPARTKLFGAMPEIFQAAKGAGARCAYLSGGGSTIAAWTTDRAEEIAAAMERAGADGGFPGRTMITEPSDEGAKVMKTE